MSRYQSFIGLEIHIHLLTKSKAFCDCKAEYGAPPNTHVCPVCLGYPGVLPSVNEEAMSMAYLVSRALNCELAQKCFFDRKNYFYPDMPKNYQITQFHQPAGVNGYFEIEVDGQLKRVGIHDVHLEEDAGKMIHQGKRSLLDYNRAGTSLLEIVTEPDLTTGAEAEAFIREFRRTVRALGVCDGNMEEGSLRCDANVSINTPGAGLGTKTEVKNLNSARFVKKALAYEIGRQGRLLDKGEKVVQETRLWDTDAQVTRSMRTKEKAHDYRYFPEPDMPPFEPDEAFLKMVEERLVELPLHRKQRYVGELGLNNDQASFLVENEVFGALFETVLAEGFKASTVANWLSVEVQGQLKRAGCSPEESHIDGARLSSVMKMVDEGTLNRSKAKEVLEQVILTDRDPLEIVATHGWAQVVDKGELVHWVNQALTANEAAVEQVKGGNNKTLSFLVGQVMRFSKGKADPKLAMAEIKRALSL